MMFVAGEADLHRLQRAVGLALRHAGSERAPEETAELGRIRGNLRFAIHVASMDGKGDIETCETCEACGWPGTVGEPCRRCAAGRADRDRP